MVSEEVKGEEFVRWFSKIDKSLKDLVGEKGTGLGELYNKKFPVPEGFVVTTSSFLKFLESAGLKEKLEKLFEETNFKDEEELKRNCETARNLISKAELPEEIKEEIFESYETLGANKLEIEKGSALDILNHATEPIFVSVRSSLPFKARDIPLREQSTYLNVKGNDALLSHIKNCFISLFNPETLKREFSLEFDFKKLKIAVVVQKMISAEKSGEVISTDLSGNVSIYAFWGLGEGKNVKGIEKDQYILSKELDLIDRKIGKKSFLVVRDSSGSLKIVKASEERGGSQVLNKYEIQRLGDLAEKAESHFGKPQKIEFAIDESGIYILQTREISAVEKKEVKEEAENPKEEGFVDEPLGEVKRVEKITKTKLKLALNSPYLVEEGSLTGLKKVGILKLEKIIERSGKHPFYFLDSHYVNQYENLIYEGIKPVSENFEEVWVRTTDFLSTRFKNLEGARKIEEENPLLGIHGIRFGLKYPEILEAELRAIKRISENTFTGILIPNIISVDELKKVKEILKKINFENVKIGILMETPAALQLIKDFCTEQIDLILINTDRLMQFLLAADRGNKEVSGLLGKVHPSFSYQLEYLVRVAKRNNVETNIFGEILNKKEVLEHLIKRGIDFITVVPENANSYAEQIYEIEKGVLGGTDSEPRDYEMNKSKEEYLKEEPSQEKTEEKEKSEEGKIESIREETPESNEKLEEDIKQIEEEKKEYAQGNSSEENSDSEQENFSSQEEHEVLHEELKENPEEEFDNGVEEIGENKKDVEEKDTLGIF